MKYRFATDGADDYVDCEDDDEAIEAAVEWLDETDWDDSSPGRVHATVYRIADDGTETNIGTATLIIEQREPACCGENPSDEHKWSSDHDLVGGIKENPGVWGHGGGVVIHEVCLYCGCERVTDTWPQDPETGEQGGWNEVSYRDSAHSEEDLRAARVRAGLEDEEDEDEDEDEEDEGE